VDHPIPVAEGGETSSENSQGLCEACNYAKQAPGWRARPSPDTDRHEIETTLPTGHRYRSRPPRIVATIRHTPVRIDYVVAV
jgi:5-methylcytosine-specific restriction endonuclease McrA